MTALVWDQVGERTYHSGVDRGVLYPSSDLSELFGDGPGVAWNGLLSVEETTSDRESKSYFIDGVKYLDYCIPGDFAGSLKAITYPDEFEEMLGIVPDNNGLLLYNQPTKAFSLAYRTLLGDDVQGTDRGYKIHILYNLTANPDTVVNSSLSNQATPTPFGWALTAVPVKISGYRPTAHVCIDSTRCDPETLAAIEEVLYGSSGSDPMLPLLDELLAMLEALSVITITDNGDGTWTAEASDEFITFIDNDTFQITSVDATYLDSDTYDVSTTNLY